MQLFPHWHKAVWWWHTLFHIVYTHGELWWKVGPTMRRESVGKGSKICASVSKLDGQINEKEFHHNDSSSDVGDVPG
jgi:hypothetical protein